MAEYFTTQEQVKDALMVDNFQNLSRDKIGEFISLVPNMDKEVAALITDQLLESQESSIKMLEQMNVMCDRTLKSNDTSQMEAINAYKEILDVLGERLKTEKLTYSQKDKIVRDMISIADRIAVKDTENKGFLLKIIGSVAFVTASVVIFTIGLLAAGGSDAGKDSKDDFEEDDDTIDIV